MGGRRQPDGMSEANLQRHHRRRGASTHDAFSACKISPKTARRDASTLHFHSKLFQENVLDGTKREYYDTWFRKNVLDGTKSWSYNHKHADRWAWLARPEGAAVGGDRDRRT